MEELTDIGKDIAVSKTLCLPNLFSNVTLREVDLKGLPPLVADKKDSCISIKKSTKHFLNYQCIILKHFEEMSVIV